MASFPYGAGLLAFLDRYDQAERTAEIRRRGELSEALAMRQVSDLDRHQHPGDGWGAHPRR